MLEYIFCSYHEIKTWFLGLLNLLPVSGWNQGRKSILNPKPEPSFRTEWTMSGWVIRWSDAHQKVYQPQLKDIYERYHKWNQTPKEKMDNYEAHIINSNSGISDGLLTYTGNDILFVFDMNVVNGKSDIPSADSDPGINNHKLIGCAAFSFGNICCFLIDPDYWETNAKDVLFKSTHNSIAKKGYVNYSINSNSAAMSAWLEKMDCLEKRESDIHDKKCEDIDVYGPNQSYRNNGDAYSEYIKRL
jgi:hypothetical protein